MLDGHHDGHKYFLLFKDIEIYMNYIFINRSFFFVFNMIIMKFDNFGVKL